ncbi:MAG: hypothetical protein K2W95_00645 [Candidatus Obscuribacterales bacterium]|nr:hypothetical protein [Candidatus Obscuribacterales bacterium]
MKPLFLILFALCLSVSDAIAQTTEEKAATVRYLQKLQDKSGGFCFTDNHDNPATVSATSAAVRALNYFGGVIDRPVATRRFVNSCFDSISGAFFDTPDGKGGVSSTALGILAATDLKMPMKKFSKPALAYLIFKCNGFEDIRIAAAGLEALHELPPKGCTWLEELEKLQNSDGSFGKDDGIARDTGGAAVAILRLGGLLKNQEKITQFLKEGQRSDGGFGKKGVPNSDLETSYRVMRAFHMLNALPANVPAMRKFISSCRNADGGYGFAPAQPSNAAGTYFAGIILHWLDTINAKIPRKD